MANAPAPQAKEKKTPKYIVPTTKELVEGMRQTIAEMEKEGRTDWDQ
jgi:hypothetical protein